MPSRASLGSATRRTVNEIVAMFPISQPAISRHLRVLREAGFVQVRPEGKHRVYSLDPRPLREIDHWLVRYRRLFAGRLHRLEAFIDGTEEKR